MRLLETRALFVIHGSNVSYFTEYSYGAHTQTRVACVEIRLSPESKDDKAAIPRHPLPPLPWIVHLCFNGATERAQNVLVHVRVQAQQANQWPASVVLPRPRPYDCISMTAGTSSSTGRMLMAAAAPGRSDSRFSEGAFRPAGLSAKRCRPRSLAGDGLWGSGMDRTPTTKKGGFSAGADSVRSLERRYLVCW